MTSSTSLRFGDTGVRKGLAMALTTKLTAHMVLGAGTHPVSWESSEGI